ncbi:uncharacterized protein LOC129595149 [Paramacrobiotus metropolitanus]|uniref:uncharacterized protein LOC129595149 n=1 Tax=Paramacrobiotus metropolitanus TaxID=2943436 RepID=UPI002445D1E5|nr:uncharacterized protein LOC129595149 [Paramacrobiotus metropolitanus]
MRIPGVIGPSSRNTRRQSLLTPSPTTLVLGEVYVAPETDADEPAFNRHCFRCRCVIMFLIVFGAAALAWSPSDSTSYKSDIRNPDVQTEADNAMWTTLRTSFIGLILTVGVLCYLIDAFTNDYARTLYDFKRLKNHLDKIREGKPKIIWHMTCFHRDNFPAVINDTEASIAPTTRNNKVTTWNGAQEFHFSSWANVTPDQQHKLSGLREIQFRKSVILADTATREAYHAQKLAFIHANRGRDAEYAIEDIIATPGYIRSLTAVTSFASGCCYCCLYIFIVVSLLLYPWLAFAPCCVQSVEFRHVFKVSINNAVQE